MGERRDWSIEPFRSEWGDALEALQRRYIKANPPGTKLVPVAYYATAPEFEGGTNIPCALEDGQLLGYGSLSPNPVEPGSDPGIPNTIWLGIRVDPTLDDVKRVWDALYAACLTRAKSLALNWQGRATRLAISYPEARQEEIGWFQAAGMTRLDAMRQLTRDLSMPLPTATQVPGIAVQTEALANKDDRQAYLAAHNSVFPGSPMSSEDLGYLLASWQGGMPVLARDVEGRIVGGVMAYWYPGIPAFTEDVFVVAEWRRRGVATWMLTEAMAYLVGAGQERAILEVLESNSAAIGLYSSLGYGTYAREEQFGLFV